MPADLIFYTNPQSRGQTVRWMLEEIGAPYETVLLEYGTTMKSAEYMAINPMGKVPAIIHKGTVVTEAPAICAYLAEALPDAGLKPDSDGLADYFRWLFFAAGPIEAAFSNQAAGFVPPEDKRAMFGYGHFDLAIETLEGAVTGKRFIAGNSFSAADVYVGSMINFLMMFGLLAPRPGFTDYVSGLTERPAYIRAKAIDAALIAEREAAAAN